MPGLPIEFRYTADDGRPVRFSLAAVHKVWLEPGRFGLVYAETLPNGRQTLREAAIDDPEAAASMREMIQDLLAVSRLEFLEAPVPPDRDHLTVEFRSPHPHTVNLAWRQS